jgi:hypothetical protein
MSRPLRFAALLLAAPLLACGGDRPTSPPADPFETAVPAARLPAVAMVGDLPSRERSLTIAIQADGTIVSEAGKTDYAGLSALLVARARAPGATFQGTESRLYFVLRVDRGVPWEVVQWVLMACAHGNVRAYRVLFAVRPEDGGEAGGLCTFFPLSRGIGPPLVERPILPLRLRPGSSAFDADAAGAAMEAIFREPEIGESLAAEIEVDVGTPTESVLVALGVCHASGITHVGLTGAPVPRPADVDVPTPSGQRTAIQAYVAAHPASAGGELLLSGRRPVAVPRATSRAPSRRLRGRLAGAPPGEETEDDGRDPLRRAHDDVWDMAEEEGMRVGLVEGAGRGRKESLGAALGWLEAHRFPGGRWPAFATRWCFGYRVHPTVIEPIPVEDDLETTALALWAFLRAPRKEPAEYLGGWHVSKALDRLSERHVAGAANLGTRDLPRFLTAHALATIVMIEAYARSNSQPFEKAAVAGLRLLAGELPAGADARTRAWIAIARSLARKRNLPLFAAAKDGATGPDAATLAEAAGTASDPEGRLLAGMAAWLRGPEAREAWRKTVAEPLAARQRTEGDACGVRGSFDPEGGRSRVRATALGALCLLADRLLAD